MTTPYRVDVNELDWDEDMRLHKGVPFSGVGFEMYPGSDSVMVSESVYSDGFREGLCREWYPSGQLKREWQASHGVAMGRMTEWHESGKVRSVGEYEFGVAIRYDEWEERGHLVVTMRIDPNSGQFKYVQMMRQRRSASLPSEEGQSGSRQD
jgi:antitoxin component YwqK of YwqJK toxin-antitoxin module